MSSLSKATVVKVETIEKHPNGDNLELTNIDGFPVVVQKGLWNAGDLAVYVPVDLVTSDEPEFDFWPNKRVKGKKLRGILSCGLLVKPRPHHSLGDDVTSELRVTVYEPEVKAESTYADSAKAPSGEVKYTDIDSIRKYHYIFNLDEEVVITEKIHGANFRAMYQEEFNVGTRTRWVKGDNIWTRVSEQYNLKDIINKYPNYIFFGEVYGHVQDLKYGHAKGALSLVFFDVFSVEQGKYLNWADCDRVLDELGLPKAPVLYKGPWLGLESHKSLADGDSLLGPNIKEGFVVRPIEERWNNKVGRVILKYHSDAFLQRK